MSVNKVILIGNEKDPDVRYLENNVCRHSHWLRQSVDILTRAVYNTDKTEWHNIVVWRLAAPGRKVCSQRDSTHISQICTRSWEDQTRFVDTQPKFMSAEYGVIGPTRRTIITETARHVPVAKYHSPANTSYNSPLKIVAMICLSNIIL